MPPFNYPIGNTPRGINVADLNGDGAIDVFTANTESNDISILFNDGSGSFLPASSISASGNPWSITACDIDNDNDSDLVMVKNAVDSISIYENDGFGNLTYIEDMLCGNVPITIISTELNNDGSIDLVVANDGSNDVSVFLNNGDGSFQSAVNYPSGDGSRCVVSADFNDDGFNDLATANEYSDNISILLSNGNGTFQSPINYTAGADPHGITAADYNGDTFYDIAVANYNNDSITVYINDGYGEFLNSSSYYIEGRNPVNLVSIDLNKDSIIDVAIVNYSQAVTLYGQGDGTFGNAKYYSVGSYPGSIAPADFNKDGAIDLAIANEHSDNVSALYNINYPQVVSTFPSQNELNVSMNTNIEVAFDIDIDASTINDSTFIVYTGSNGLHLGDINYNSLSKAVMFNPYSDFNAGEYVTVILTSDVRSADSVNLSNSFSWSFINMVGGGRGIFDTTIYYSVGSGTWSVYPIDINEDGALDLATANSYSNDVGILINNGNGIFSLDTTYSVGQDPQSVFSVDLDNDNDPDLITANRISDDISIMWNDGDGFFSEYSTYSVGLTPVSVFSVDIDGNGYLDIITGNLGSSNVSILINNGNHSFTLDSSYQVGDGPQHVQAADLNNDGHFDMAVANSQSNSVSVLLNNGDGVFSNPAYYSVGEGPRAICLADIDEDNDLDLIVTNHHSNYISIFKNNSYGVFEYYSNYVVGTWATSIFYSDFEGDGDLDLAISLASVPQKVIVLSNNGNGDFTALSEYPVGGAPRTVYCTDIDNDADIDIITANSNSSNISVLTNLGDASLILKIGILNESSMSNVVNHLPIFYWEYMKPYGFNQTKFEIEVGLDSDWEHAEMWDPSPYETADTFITYDGFPLIDGVLYFLRIRLSNGEYWKDWFEITYRMNSIPSAPFSLYPLDDDVTGNTPTLWVENSFDAEGDTLTYDFSGFHDTDCVAPIIDLQGVSEGTDSTGGQVIGLLGENCIYWWSARAYDGYEYSDGSPTQRFFIDGTPEPPTAFHVQYPPDTSGWYVFDMLSNFLWEKSYDPDPLDSLHYTLQVAIDSNLQFVFSIDSIWNPWHTLTDSLEFATQYWWKVKATDNTGRFTYSSNILTFKTWKLGDANGDWQVNIFDITFIITYLYLDGPALGQLIMGDVNGDCVINIFDITYLIAYLYLDGPEPKVGCE